MAEIDKLSPEVLAVADRVCRGRIVTTRRRPDFVAKLPEVRVLSCPTSPWASEIDKIESTVLGDNDDLEYGNNLSLRLMGLYEIREMLKAFGIPTQKQTRYDLEPAKGKSFLVVGMGPGREVVALAALGAEVTGFDATKGYADIAAQRIQKASSQLGKNLPVNLFQSLAEEFPYEDYPADGISMLFGVINHVEKWEETIGKLRRGLNPDGKLVIEKYGSNDALVFQHTQGELPYQPSILQRRDPAGRGIVLGEDQNVFPTSFPDDQTFSEALERSGLQIVKKIGFLRIASLFPQDPTVENLKSFLSLVEQVDPQAFQAIDRLPLDKPETILLKVFAYDLKSQSRKRHPTDLDDYAYLMYVTQPREN